jgi:hypothetical protein
VCIERVYQIVLRILSVCLSLTSSLHVSFVVLSLPKKLTASQLTLYWGCELAILNVEQREPLTSHDSRMASEDIRSRRWGRVRQ